MRIEKTDLLKLIIAVVVFSASIPFTIFQANEIFGQLSLVAVWLVALTMIPKQEFFARFYYLLFGVFFVLPPALSDKLDFLAVGQFFKNISLSATDILEMQLAIFIFLFTFPVVIIFRQQRRANPTGNIPIQIRNYDAMTSLILITFTAILSFNIMEAEAVYSQGYQEYFSGNLSIQKNLAILIVEYIFIILSLFGISAKKILPFILLTVYAASLVITGQRMPGATLLVVLLATAFPNGFLRRHFFFLAVLGFGVAPPFMMVVQTLRAAGLDGLAGIDFLYLFTDFWAVIGHSLDTLKAAVISDQISGVDVNLFARVNLTLNVIFSRLLDIKLGLNVNGFGSSFSQYFAPDLFFEKHVTFASSGIAESYFALGLLGVLLYAGAAAWISQIFQISMDSRTPLALLTLYIFSPRFLVGVRNELFGWIFEGAIYFVTMYPIYRLLHVLFVRVKTQSAS